jgi:integrase
MENRIMPTIQRVRTKYPGVMYIVGKSTVNGKPEKIYYVRYRKNGKEIEEKAGRQFQDDMTPAKAAILRAMRIEGKQLSNRKRREADIFRREAQESRWTIGKLWVEYKKNNPKLKGLRTDENRFEKYLKPLFGSREPNELLPLDVARLKVELQKKKAPATVRNVLELLRRIVNFGHKNKLCQGINFTIQMPTVNNEKTEDLTSEQLANLLKVIEKDTHQQAGSMMKMALFTGMRRGEMFKLKWKHVDFERGFILIKDPKGGPDEKIPLNDASRELIDKIPQTDSPYVFPGRGGRRRTDINKAVNEIKTAAGLPRDFRPLHGLRHVYASMLASSGQVDMYTLQKLLTHKDPKMTQRYAHLRDDALKKAANLAGELISEAGLYKKRDKKDKKNKIIEK